MANYEEDPNSGRRALDMKQKRAEDAWTTKAIQDVLKDLSTRKSAMEDLDYALETRGHYAHCVAVPRPARDRNGIMPTLEPLHVAYCRTYRFPNLGSYTDLALINYQYEQLLRSVPDCAYPYDGTTKEVCINPYHYERPNYGRGGRYNDRDGYEGGGPYMGGGSRSQMRPSGVNFGGRCPPNYSRGPSFSGTPPAAAAAPRFPP